MKKTFFSILGVFLLCSGVTITACSGEEKASIMLSSDYFVQTTDDSNLVEVSLNEGDENFVTVVGKVNNASDGRLKISNSFENIVFTSIDYNSSKNESIITISGVSEGNATLYFNSYTGSADPVKLDVFVYSDITGLRQVENINEKNTQFVEKDKAKNLDPKAFLNFSSREGGESNRKEVNWSFKDADGYVKQTQNDSYVLLKDGQVVASIDSQNNLLVTSDFQEDTITLIAESKYTEYFADVELVVLESFDEENVSVEYARESGSFASFEDFAVVDSEKEFAVSIVRNDDSVEQAKFFVSIDVDCKYDYDITPIVSLDKNGKILTNEFLRVEKFSEDGSKHIYQVQGKKSDLKPTSVYLSFNIELSDYDSSVKTTAVKFAISDVVSQMIVSTEDGQANSGERFEVYNNYENDKGMLFNVQLKPDTVLEGLDTFKIILTPSFVVSNVDQLSSYISLNCAGVPIQFSKNGDLFEAYFDNEYQIGFADNSEVFVTAGEMLCSSDSEIKIKFVSTQTESVFSEFFIKGQRAPGSEFSLTSQTKMLATNNLNNQVEFNVAVTGIESANGLYLSYDNSLPISISDLRFENGTLSFSVSNEDINFSKTIEFTLKHKNGRTCKEKIVLKTFMPLESARITLDNTNSSGISQYTYSADGSLSSVVMTTGSVAKLNFNVVGEFSAKILNGQEFLGSDGILTALATEKQVKEISVQFDGKDLNGEDYSIVKTFDMEVYVPVSTVNPKKAEDLNVNLIAEDSLSSEDIGLSRKQISIKLRNDNYIATYTDLDLFRVSSSTSRASALLSESMNGQIVFSADNFSYAIENASIEDNILTFEIVAKSTNGFASFKDTLNISYNKFNANIRSAITLNVNNASRVEKLVWENEQDSIYLNQNGDIKERSFVFVTSIYPANAYNKNLTYIFAPDNGTNANLISISENGVVTLNNEPVGGSGYIFVLPSDSVKLKNGIKTLVYLDKTDSYNPKSIALTSLAQNFDLITENGYLLSGISSSESSYVSFAEIFKKIRVVVADGLTEETALRIYNKEQFKEINPQRHYEIMADLELDSLDTIQKLSGSIRGYITEANKNLETKGSRSDIQIKITNSSFVSQITHSSFVSQITQTGKVRDLTFVGSAKDAFVAKENNGTISNISINVLIENNSISSSSVSGEIAGAVASTNNGSIDACAVLGATVTGTNYAGGIAGENLGTITKSFVEIYNFETSANKISATGDSSYAGGIVGYSNGGSIEECYVYDYSLTAGSGVNITAANVGALIGKVAPLTEEGSGAAGAKQSSIKNSFAVVGISSFVSEVENVLIEDAYTSYYKQTSGEGETPITYQYKSNKSDVVKSDYWLAGAGAVAYVNGEFDHLKFYQELKGESTDTIKTIKGKSLYVSDGTGILMLYETKVSKTTLTLSQQNTLDRNNTISLKDLFGDSNVVVTSNNNSVVLLTVSSLVVKAEGTATLTVYSNKDFSSKKQIEIKVIYAISDFASDTEFNRISVQEGFTKSINYSIKNSVFLGSDEYEIIHDAYTLNSSLTPQSNNITLNVNGFNVTVEVKGVSENGKDNYDLNVSLKVNSFENESDSIYNNALEREFNNTVTLQAFKGARFIGISNEEIIVYPAMVTNLDVDLQTDSSSDFIKLEIKNSNGETLTSEAKESENTFVFSDGQEKIEIKQTSENNNEFAGNIKYILTISVSENYKNQILDDETYDLFITSNSQTASNENACVKLTLKSQTINHIDMTNYLFESVTLAQEGQLVYTRSNQISSTLSPGKTSFMVIGVDPSFAYYDYFTVDAMAEGGKGLSLAKMKLQNGTSYAQYVSDNDSGISYEGYKLKVVPSTREEQYIFKIYSPTSIKESIIVPFVISFYDKNNNVLQQETYDILISYQVPAELVVNENKNSVIAKGGTADIVVTVGENQKLDSLSLVSVQNGISINNFAGPFENTNKTKYYTATLYASTDASVVGEGGLGNFQIKAEVSRVLNGVLEIQETRTEMTLVSVAIVSSKANITSRVGITDEFDLNYRFNPEEYSEQDEQTERLENIRSQFINNGYYNEQNIKFAINPKGNNGGSEITDRLYVVSGTSQTKVEFNDLGIANCGSFELIYNKDHEDGESPLKIRGKSTTSSSITLRLDNYIYVDKNLSSYNVISNYYNISVETYTDEDLPAVIRTAEQFLNIKENKTAENYILMNDIELVDYEPFDTTMIASFDGNGYTINITSFNLDGTGTLERALFKNIASLTTLKNIRVNYYLGGEMEVDISSTRGYNTVKIAGFAITNNGIITNCHVMSSPYTSTYRSKAHSEQGIIVDFTRFSSSATISNESVEIAGFVISNNGNITNSTVGGESFVSLRSDSETTTVHADTKALGKFSIISQGTISGFVLSNSKVIASSSVDNIEIINNSPNIKYYTSGFANSNTGRISTSFVEGLYESGATNTEKTKCLSGSKIASKGFVSGFISNNAGSIDNSYSNILIQGPQDQTTSYFASGFVYVNTGKITTSYSSAKIESSNISQTSFSGVDVRGNSLNSGSITLSYYNGLEIAYDDNDVENVISSGAIIAKTPTSQSQFYGFTFASSMTANDGIWFINDGILTLVAPNQKAFSHRVFQAVNDTYVLPYAKIVLDDVSSEQTNYEYGAKNNPIIIRNAQEFSDAMGGADISTNIAKFCQNGKIDGSYRLVSDINLSELNSVDGIAVIKSTQNSFSGVLDGNGFKISNISIAGDSYSIGLFSQIYQGSVLNLELEFLSVAATKSALVGGLAGLVYSSSIINITAEQSIPTQSTDSGEFGIKGTNAVGGIAGAVFGDSKIENVSFSDPIVQAVYYDENHEIDDNFYTGTNSNSKKEKPSEIRKILNSIANDNLKMISLIGLQSLCRSGQYLSTVSYAGGLFGYVDTYKDVEANESVYYGRVISNNDYNILNLRVTNTANVRGEITGGLVGYVGINTKIKDAAIVISQANITSNLLSYNAVVGGVVGFNAGTLFEIFAEYDESLQESIERNYSNYYAGSSGIARGHLDIFENTLSWTESNNEVISYKPKYIGGLVGYARCGRLLSSYSKINVISSVTDAVAGGIVGKVGIPENGEVFLEQQNGQNVSTTFKIFEVYSSGDVLGGPQRNSETTHISGGIVGELDSKAKLTLSAVNSVNYFGVQNSNYYTESRLNTAQANETVNLNLSNIGIYAIVGKMNSGSTITPLMPVTATSISDKHIGYIAKISSSAFATEINVLPYEGYTEDDNDAYFKINSLSVIGDAQAGREEMNGAFLGSGNWSSENWEHSLDKVFPTLKLITVTDFVFWDQDNTDYILSLMKNGTTKEIRVRGLTSTNDLADITIDLTIEKIRNYFPINNFYGSLVGGWNKYGERSADNINIKSLIISYNSSVSSEKLNFFETLGSGVNFDTVKIKYQPDTNAKTTVTGGLFIKNETSNATFRNVEIDVSQINLTINTNSNGQAGIITPSAVNTSFNNTTIFVSNDQNETVKFEATSSSENVYTGLLAGQIRQANKYKLLEISNTTIKYYNSSAAIAQTTINQNSSVYAGLIAGFVERETGAATLNIGNVKFEKTNNNQQQNNAITIKVNDEYTANDLYLGGLFGKVQGASSVSLSDAGDSNFQIDALAFTGNGFVGGLFGNLQADTVSVNFDKDYVSKITYKASGSSNFGGMFGHVQTNKLEITAKTFDFDIEGADLTGNANIGGIAGQAEANSNSSLSVSITANGQKALTDEIQTNFVSIIETGTVSNDANIGGFFGDERATSLTLKLSSVYSRLDLSGANTLNAGLYAGSKTNGGSDYKFSNGQNSGLSFNGLIVGQNSYTTANIAGLIGNNSGTVNVANITLDIKIGSSTDPVFGTKNSIADDYTLSGISAGQANIGGYIGTSSGAISVVGGEITESSEIAVSSTSATNVGGIVGVTTGNLTVQGVFKNRGLFAVSNNTSNETNIGGLVGLVGGLAGSANTQTVQIGSNSQESNNRTTSAFVDANFFVSANKVNLGGMIGKLSSMASGSYINDTIFGGAFKSFETEVKNEQNEVTGTFGINQATHVFGGIVGKTESEVNGTLAYNSSFGDDIVTYGKDEKRFDSYTFGGIVGNNNGLTVENNNSLTTVNNDRIASTDNRGAIVGNNVSGSYSNTTNLFSHVVNLATDANGEDNKGTDVGYITEYIAGQGYGTSGTSDPLANTIKTKVERITDFSNYATLGSKLNPYILDSTESQTLAGETNGVSYFAFKDDGDVSSQVNKTGYNGAKRAIIGNARTLTYTNTTSGSAELSFVSRTLSQNEIISGMNLNIDISDDNGKTLGGLVSTMTGGTIYAVALSGKLSVGGTSVINLGTITTINGGLISETNSSVDVIYRAGGKDSNGNYGQVSGFASVCRNNKGEINSIDIQNSYSTGQVSTYIDAEAYAFSDGDSKKVSNIRITNCYTISQIDQNDYTTEDDPSATKSNFGPATLKNCWYDKNATEVAQTTVNELGEKSTANVALSYGNNNADSIINNGFSASVTGWVQSTAYNFGYATRNFGYLKQSSYAVLNSNYGTDTNFAVEGEDSTIEKNGDDKYIRLTWTNSTDSISTNTQKYLIVPNAGKLAQIKDNVDDENSQIVGNYVQWYDFDLKSASTDTSKSTVNDGNLTKIHITNSKTEKNNNNEDVTTVYPFAGTYDGQEKTIKNGTEALFNIISGTVKNLRITDVDISKTAIDKKVDVGALAEQLQGGTINNVIASGSIKGASNTSVPNNNNDRNNTYHIGGIVGFAEGKEEGNASIQNCKNYAKILFTGPTTSNQGEGKGDADVGGIVGNIDQKSNSVTITNCVNFGPIQNDSAGFGGTGGIVGYMKNATVENCGNANSVLSGYILSCSKTDGFVAGGIAGNVASGEISNCYNTAMVKAGNKSSTLAYAGGIVGKAGSGTFTDLYNSGVVEALGNNGTWETTNSGMNVTISTSTPVNVYAEGIIGNGLSVTGYLNNGQVVRNGVHNKKVFNDPSDNTKVKAQTYTCEWDANTVVLDIKDDKKSTDTKKYRLLDINVYEYSVNSTGKDDLDYPTSFCITAKRDVEICNEEQYERHGDVIYYGKGTGTYIVQNQTIISKTYTLSDEQSYYEKSKSREERDEDGVDPTDLLGNLNDISQNNAQTVTIAGASYSIVTDSNSFNVAAEDSDVTGIILKADITSRHHYGSFTKNISGNGYFINYNNYNGGDFISNSSNLYNENLFIKDTNFAGIIEIGGTGEKAIAASQSSGNLKNINTYGVLCVIGTPKSDSYFVTSSTDKAVNCKNYANYSAFNDEYTQDSESIKFGDIDENYGVIIGFDGKDGFSELTSYAIVSSSNIASGKITIINEEVEWKTEFSSETVKFSIGARNDYSETGIFKIVFDSVWYSYKFSSTDYKAGALVKFSIFKKDENTVDGKKGQSFTNLSFVNYGIIKAGNGGYGGRGGDGYIGHDSTTAAAAPTAGTSGGSGGSAGTAGNVANSYSYITYNNRKFIVKNDQAVVENTAYKKYSSYVTWNSKCYGISSDNKVTIDGITYDINGTKLTKNNQEVDKISDKTYSITSKDVVIIKNQIYDVKSYNTTTNSNPGNAGFSGNTGHGGLWLAEVEIQFTITSPSQNSTTNVGGLFKYSSYQPDLTINSFAYSMRNLNGDTRWETGSDNSWETDNGRNPGQISFAWSSRCNTAVEQLVTKYDDIAITYIEGYSSSSISVKMRYIPLVGVTDINAVYGTQKNTQNQ